VTRPASRLELLRAAPPGIAPFALVAEAAGDRYFAPHLRRHGIWEAAETLVLLRLLAPGMRVVDVGAHVGYYSVMCSRRVGPGGGVLAFEPEPENHRLLQANLLLNDCRNVQVRQVALADGRGRASLHLSDENFGDHRLQAVAGRRTVDVETLTLDEALDGFEPDFVKIDTQGAEPRILRGMARLLERRRDVLACQIEFAPGLLARDGVTLAQHAQFLRDLGVRAYRPRLAERRVTLQTLQPLDAGLAATADDLASWGQEDASADLLVFFSSAAEAAWLQRFRG